MNDDRENELMKRLAELSARAEAQTVYTHSIFLTPAEQAAAAALSLPLPPVFCGGHEEAERKLAVFGSEALFGYEDTPPVTWLKIAPKQPKFADILTHRDFLGALLSLGIRRDLLGDILLADNCGYLFCLDPPADYILSSLDAVKRTPVAVTRLSALPPEAAVRLRAEELVAASPRLDALIAAIWHLSRGEAKEAVQKELVSADGKIITDPSASPAPGCRLSLRGFGKCIYDGPLRETGSGRLRFAVRRFV